MCHLWNYTQAAYPLPPDFPIRTPLTALDLGHSLLANVSFVGAMRGCRSSMAHNKDVPHVIEILTCNDDLVCSACRKIAGRKYEKPDVVPELPHEDCTNPHGCRCWVMYRTNITARH